MSAPVVEQVQASSLQAPPAVRRTNAERQRGDVVDECFVCGRGLSERGLERASWIEHTTSGYLVAVADPSPSDSQGCFPVGSECAKTVPAAFRLKGIR